MVRKQRPVIHGTDPNYTTNFVSSKEAKLSALAAQINPVPPTRNPERANTLIPEKPLTKEVEDQTTIAALGLEGHGAEQIAVTGAGSGSEAVSVTARAPKKAAASIKTTMPEKQRPTPASPVKREIGLDAAAKAEHGDKLKALEEQGFKMRDVLQLAGRRAVGRFELKPTFVPKQDVERLLTRTGGYHTTKRLSANIVDDLRDKHDPLRLRSDSAMVRGQFEPLFWTCLDEVIEELQNKRFREGRGKPH